MLGGAGLCLLLSACGRDGDVTIAPPSDAVTVSGVRIIVRLDHISALAAPPSALFIREQQIVVLRLAAAEYRAFTNICTHSGCGVSRFETGRLICPCHGSEFDIDGRNVRGPAPLPLARYSTLLDTAAATLTIDTSVVLELSA